MKTNKTWISVESGSQNVLNFAKSVVTESQMFHSVSHKNALLNLEGEADDTDRHNSKTKPVVHGTL